MYHRVATPPIDPWGLAVHPDRFDQQLAVLRRRRHPLPMAEFVDRLQRGTLPHKAVAVTFDDGYVDNLTEARPRLAAAGVPATLFLTTGFVGQPREYWWDELARGILLRASALNDAVHIGDVRIPLEFGDDGERDVTWRAWLQPRTERQATYAMAWKHLRAAAAPVREEAMARLRAVLDIPPPDPWDLPMNESQVATLAADGCFEFGGHSATHPVLPALDPADRRREIADGRAECERLVGRRIAGFAYPHGAVDDDSRAAVRDCGFAWACTTESRGISSGDVDRYALPRLGVLDWDGPAFERALENLRA
jgi:peptidoglycan/xylan/chitin deacetylase (PgdA/CDA1 family)